MKKLLLLTFGGVFLIAVLYFFGRTEPVKKPGGPTQKIAVKSFDINEFISSSRQKLSPDQNVFLGGLENSISRGDVNQQQIINYSRLAGFWKDSIHLFEPYAWYTAEAAKLDKSEKNLTFAARLFLENLRGETDEARLNWKTGQAIDLFNRALAIHPDNDDLRIGLASCYVYGKGRFGGTEETMKGITQLLEVVRRDSTNMKAQLVLGVGGFVSGQYDKAIDRFQRVIRAEPGNLEAVAFLADTYAAKGEKAEAIKWYTISKQMANNPHYSEEVDERIKQLR